MTTYYISTVGSDSNNGLSPDATTANTNKPWLTLGKAMNTGSPVVPGDTVYVGPGYYYSAGVTPIAGISSVASPTQFIGDPTNAQGFKNSSGVLLAAGIPWVTTRTSGEGIDGAAASSGFLITAGTNNPKGLQFKNLMLEALLGVIWNQNYNGSTDTLFQDCILSSTTIVTFGTGAPTAGMNLTFRRCFFHCSTFFSASTTTAAATADADLAILIEECEGVGIVCSGIALGASGGNIGGGIRLYDNTIIARTTLIGTTALRISTTNPVRFGGNLIVGTNVLVNAGTSGQVIDDGYNRAFGNSASVNFTQAGTTFIGVAPNINNPALVKWGLQMPRPDFLGWSDAAHANQKFSASGRTTPDFFGRTVRPWGAGSSIGCFQALDVVQDTSSSITGGGANSLKITGAGEISFWIPVDAAGFTVSVTTKSTSYGGTNYPQLVVVANPSVGVTTDTTVTASSASETAITTATITPTSKGVMEVRLISRSTSTTSVTYFDLLSAT